MFCQLLGIIGKNIGDYILWLLGNIGGLLMAYLACSTIRIIHGQWGTYLPGPEVYLISGTMTILVAGVSYIKLPLDEKTTSLSPYLSLTWWFPVVCAYGVIAVVGVKQPIRTIGEMYAISSLIFLSCLLWASLIWAHEHGLREAFREEPQPPKAPKLETASLPKL